MKIQLSTLLTIKQMLFDSVETCGNFKINQDVITLDNIITGKIEVKTSRGMCQLHSYSKYIWHTHPHCVRSYPSYEDIQQVVNNPDQISTSIIVCSWGIWILSNHNHHINTKVNNENKSLIQYQLDRIGITTDIRESVDSTSKPLQEYFAPVINDVCANIIKVTNIKIKLIDWNSLQKIKSLHIN